ncbi:conserved phage C-terminal domain-containing protein, partial [Bacillus vallismortis]
ISNWEKHQNLDAMEKIREQNRKRVQKHREKQKVLQLSPSSNVTSNVTETESNAIDIDKELDIDKEKDKDILSGKPDDSSSSKKDKEEIPYKLIIDLLNKVSGKNYRSATQKTRSLIKARWNEGFRFNDFKHVILVKTQEWLNDPEMNKFIRPETLFGTKFENYLNQKGGRQFDSSPANETNQYSGLF